MIPSLKLIRQLGQCAATCEMCANACLRETDIKRMVNCIRLDGDCEKICRLTAGFLASESRHLKTVMKLCIEICNECCRECAQHDMDHCEECATTCAECATACEAFLDSNS